MKRRWGCQTHPQALTFLSNHAVPLLIFVSDYALLQALAVGALAVVLAWDVWRAERRRALRLAGVLAACLGLLALGLRPSVVRPAPPVEALLVTPDAPPGRLRALADSLRPDVIFALPDADVAPLSRNQRASVVSIPDVAYLARERPDVRVVRLAGSLGATDLRALGPIRLAAAHLPPPMPGVHALHPAARATVGQPWRLAGRVLLPDTAAHALTLAGPAGPLDSVTVRATDGGRLVPFAMEMTPREAGRRRLALTLASARGDTVRADTLGLVVAPRRLPAVLVLEGAPQFETQTLARWLTEEGGAVAVRSAISRNRARIEVANRAALPEDARAAVTPARLRRLRPETLAAFDAVVLDPRAWAAAPRAERQALADAVQRGLGLLVLGDPADAPALAATLGITGFGRRAVRAGVLPRAGFRLARLTWDAAPFATTPDVPVLPLSIRVAEDDAARVLATDAEGRAVAAVRPVRRGRFAASLAAETDRWRREGRPEVFAAFWTHLLDAVARPQPLPRVAFHADGGGPVTRHAPLRLALRAEAAPPAVRWHDEAATEAVALAPSQDALVLARWHATAWPRRTGWHAVTVTSRDAGGVADTSAVYVHGAKAWASWRRARRLEATRDAVRQPTEDAAVPREDDALREDNARAVPVPLPRWPFFALFVLGAGGLWAEAKWTAPATTRSVAT